MSKPEQVLALHEERKVPAQSSQGNIVSVIERVLMDPTISIDRLERLLEMQKEARIEAARIEYNNALSAAQNEMRVVIADKDNKQTHSRYASYAALDSAVRPIYTKHGFAVTFNTVECPKADHIRMTADVSLGAHESRYTLDVAADGKGAKGGDVMTKTHATMSALSYGRRGLLVMIFNIPVADKWDDDGNAAGGGIAPETITAEQVGRLRQAIQFKGRDEAEVCKWAKIEGLEDLLAKDFDQAMRVVANAKERAK